MSRVGGEAGLDQLKARTRRACDGPNPRIVVAGAMVGLVLCGAQLNSDLLGKALVHAQACSTWLALPRTPSSRRGQSVGASERLELLSAGVLGAWASFGPVGQLFQRNHRLCEKVRRAVFQSSG